MKSDNVNHPVVLVVAFICGLLIVFLATSRGKSVLESIGVALLVPGIFLALSNFIPSSYMIQRPSTKRSIKRMKSELRMLGISLYDVHSNQENFRTLIEKIARKSKSVLKFKFLLLDPESEFLRQREKEEESEEGRLKREVELAMAALEDIKKIL